MGEAEAVEIGEYEYQAPLAPVWPRLLRIMFRSQEFMMLSKLKSNSGFHLVEAGLEPIAALTRL